MLGAAPATAFLTTSDPVRAREFYGRTLGLELAEETSFALVFRLAGATLRVARARQVEPAGSTVLGWSVESLEPVMAELAARGVGFARFDGLEQDPAGVWRAPGGARIAWFRDPDGNLLSLTEPRG